MTLKNIVTTNLKIKVTVNEEVIVAYTMTPTFSELFKCGGYSCLAGTIEIMLTAITSLTLAGVCAEATIVISGSSTKVFANGSKVLLEGDSGSTEGTFINPTTGATQMGTIKVEITNAGQDKVKAA